MLDGVIKHTSTIGDRYQSGIWFDCLYSRFILSHCQPTLESKWPAQSPLIRRLLSRRERRSSLGISPINFCVFATPHGESLRVSMDVSVVDSRELSLCPVLVTVPIRLPETSVPTDSSKLLSTTFLNWRCLWCTTVHTPQPSHTLFPPESERISFKEQNN